MTKKNNPKLINAWRFYDWANSVHSLVISSAVFPIYYATITLSGSKNPVKIFGLEPETALNYSLAFSFLIIIFISPILSSIADTIGNKKKFMQFFCYLGGLSCIGLFFLTDENIIFGLILNALAGIGFWGSLVFYNAYLPEIVTNDKMDKVSAQGYMIGYIGSVVLLIICLILIQVIAPEGKQGLFTRICFVLVGIWWIGFAQYTFKHLPTNSSGKKIPKNILTSSFIELKKVFIELNSYKSLRIFLSSFFFYSLGMQTIILVAALFGKSEIGLETSELIMTILLIQVEATIGAWLFSFSSGKIGNRNTLLIGIFIWVIVCLMSFLINRESIHVKTEFYIIAALVGLVLGGTQSLSRSTYAKLLPKTNDPTTFFSFYDVFEKLALFFGLVIYGSFIQITGGMKTSALAMAVAFIISFIILLFLKKNQTKKL